MNSNLTIEKFSLCILIVCCFVALILEQSAKNLFLLGITYFATHVVYGLCQAYGNPTYLKQWSNSYLCASPFVWLQRTYVLFGLLLILFGVSVSEIILDSGLCIQKTAFFVLGGAYILWGVTRMFHDWEYYRDAFGKIRID